MKISSRVKGIAIEAVCGLFILLFVYAAVSKLLDFENFRIQIAQSPVTAAYAAPLSVIVPVAELAISVLLLFKKFRRAALLAAYTLMLVFTGYIYIVLHYSSYIPCSCGGILEEMGWTAHLYFNLAFVLLAAAALLLSGPNGSRFTGPVMQLFVFGLLGLGMIGILYKRSATTMQEHNTFIRNFPHNPNKVREADLRYNSYYFAGTADDTLYLGNTTAPLIVTRLDTLLSGLEQDTIRLLPDNLPFQSLQLEVGTSGFYLSDGTVPVIFRGHQRHGWKAREAWRGSIYFSQARAVDTSFIAVRCFDRDNTFTLAGIHLPNGKVSIKRGLLQRQVDGRFDVDGTLQFDAKQEKLMYQYYYRNQFLLADNRLNLISRGKTIDTIDKAQVQVAYVKSHREYKLSAPPLTVNNNACIDNGFLFVQSALRGRFEKEDMWREASIIDVYDAAANRYISSFYVYHERGEKLRSFMVNGNHFYGLLGRYLVDYQLHPAIFTTTK
ncbi:MauE/DoxX family redox-associated membrane protein [Flavobacterium sp. MK4S-17]|uniref:MauE/DoxX family redox-associated membrane protein n=1 Tax=Flavobacterium sp. MK4S-17 TaxID=2543737 RepID=UPI00135B3776|nr:MauE/DoxX family redox-associated membrane protein [Flavobacterium sp. MK4S-17]